jgi:hypothetical protein
MVNARIRYLGGCLDRVLFSSWFLSSTKLFGDIIMEMIRAAVEHSAGSRNEGMASSSANLP